MKINFKKSGFTLSEVLICLGLIGVLSTLTIPTIGNSVQKKSRLAEFRSAYAKMESTLKNLELNHGGIYACYSGEALDSSDFEDYGLKRNETAPTAVGECSIFIHSFTRALGATRTCNGKGENKTPISGGCIPASNYPKYICGMNFAEAKQAYVFDNSMIFMTMYEPTNELFPSAFAIDVNGRKGPNKWGQDIFLFSLAVTETKTVNGIEYVKNVGFLQPNVEKECYASKDGKSTHDMIKESSEIKD